MTPSLKSFTSHIADRCQKALIATYQIKNIRSLSLATSLRLFDLKVAPIASYALPLIWEYLSPTQLSSLDKVKPTYLKRVLSLARNTKNRLVYLMSGTDTFIEQLQRVLKLPQTPAFNEFLNKQSEKFAMIDADFFVTPVMTTRRGENAGGRADTS